MAIPTVTTAKNIDFSRPGAGVEGYDITVQNIGARYGKLFANRTNPAGGSKQIWDAIQGNTNRSLQRSPDSVVAKDFNQFLQDGKWPDKPSPGFLRYAAQSIDYGLRETGRSAQHKQGWLDSFLGQVVVLVAQVAAGFIPIVGPYVSMAIGGAVGYARTGSVLGTVSGAVSGYAAGTFGAGLASGALTAPAAGAGIAATGGGTGTANFLTNVGVGLASSGVSTAISAVGLGVSLIAGGKAIAKPRGGGGSAFALPVVAKTAQEQAEDVHKKATVTARKAATEESRAGRRNSWLAEGAHTGAGDPRNLGLKSPQARPVGAMVIPMSAGRRPVARPAAQPISTQIPTISGRSSDSIRRPVRLAA